MSQWNYHEPAQPVGPYRGSLLSLARMLATSKAFQQKVQAAGAAEARKKVFLFEHEDDPVALQALRPFAMVWPTAVDFTLDSSGARNHFRGAGALSLLLSDADRSAGTAPADRQAAAIAFCDWLDAVLGDLAAMAGKDDHLAITEIHQVPGAIGRSATRDEAASGRYWWAQFTVSWGGGG